MHRVSIRVRPRRIRNGDQVHGRRPGAEPLQHTLPPFEGSVEALKLPES